MEWGEYIRHRLRLLVFILREKMTLLNLPMPSLHLFELEL